MPIDETVLYEEFVRVRQEAVELTDRFRDAPADSPNRDLLWNLAMRKTEDARLLLVTWLDADREEPDPDPVPALTSC